jgi:hypothetical protein
MDDVLAAQERFDRAELTGDRATLRELIDDDFLSIGPKGFVLDRTRWIDRHDLFSYDALETDDVNVRRYTDDVTIVRNVQRNRATWAGKDVAVSTRVSQVWLRRGEAWRIVGIQFSPLAEG